MSGAKDPSQQELTDLIEKGFGTLLTENEIAEKKKDGQLPEDFTIPNGFGVYRVEIKGEGFLCITKLLCQKCTRNNGEVKKCAEHTKNSTAVAQKKKVTSKTGKGGKLRHENEKNEEEKVIEGAVTPYAILAPGIGGAIILVRIKATGNKKAGPPAVNMHCEQGVLIRGPDNIPQFVPKSKFGPKGKKRFDKYAEGELIMLIDKALFIPKTRHCVEVRKTKKPTAAETKVTENVGTKNMVVCVQVDVADNGMPLMKLVKDKPKDKEAPIGVVLKVNEQVQFVQVGGKEIGGGDNAPLVSTTPGDEMKKGDVIADIYMAKNGKARSAKSQNVPKDAKVIGKVVVGNNGQPVFVADGEKIEEAMKANDKEMTPNVQELLEKAQIEAIAKSTGDSPEKVAEQISKIGNKKEAVKNLNDKENEVNNKEDDTQKPEDDLNEKRTKDPPGSKKVSVPDPSRTDPKNQILDEKQKESNGTGTQKGQSVVGGVVVPGGSNDEKQAGNTGADKVYDTGTFGEVKSLGLGSREYGGSVFATKKK